MQNSEIIICVYIHNILWNKCKWEKQLKTETKCDKSHAKKNVK